MRSAWARTDFLLTSRRRADCAALRGTLDFILDTVSAPHDLHAYLRLLARDGAMVHVGAPPSPPPSRHSP